MPRMNIQDAHRLAVERHAAGRLAEAESLCRQILAAAPDRSNTLQLLGLIRLAHGDASGAAETLERAAAVDPDSAECRNRLGVALAALGRHDDAARSFRRAIDLRPGFAAAHFNLGNALSDSGRREEAVDAFRRAIDVEPDFVDAMNNLARTLWSLGRSVEAIDMQRRALAARPDSPELHNNLGSMLLDPQDPEPAAAMFREAIRLRPDFADAHVNLAAALYDQGRFEEAAASCRRALASNPNSSEAHYNLGNALLRLDDPDAAIPGYRAALALRPDHADALNNLGNALKETGRVDEARACMNRAAELSGDSRLAGNALYTLYFLPGISAPEILDHHQRWNRRFAKPLLGDIPPHANDPSPDRVLRVGFVSPDFREHPVGRFLLPLLTNLSPAAVETICYSDVRRPDAMTDRLRSCAAMWRPTRNLDDPHLADRIREDRVDILIDLTMHMRGTRMMTFARRPAPVQATYLAYCGTTGLSTMDFRLTDPWLDPPDRENPACSERSIRLARTYWCYQPSEAAMPRPIERDRPLTFGCLNNYSKVNESVLAAWARILRRTPGSELVIHAHPGSHRDRARAVIAAAGVDPSRVRFVGRLPAETYFEQHRRIDLALDPFPYPGGTTTCDALWSGAPLVTLAGDFAHTRAGLSILSNLNLPELIAFDVDRYIEIAADLAADRSRLAELRSTLRDRMIASPLMDAPRFASDFETALRGMWRDWCARAERAR